VERPPGEDVALALVRERGRFSRDLGIDVDAGGAEVDRWLLAATLFGTRISTSVAVRTMRTLDASGVRTVADAARRRRSTLIRLLDDGGYARYDERTATRLRALANAVHDSFPDGVDAWGRSCRTADELVAGLDALPGWGPVTVRAFLRELRGVWPAADLPPDERADHAARELGLVGADGLTVTALHRTAARAGVDPRDLEVGLVRWDLAGRSRRSPAAAEDHATGSRRGAGHLPPRDDT
jgi:hypothetical protein